VTTGNEIVRGAKRVFIREGYAFGYESDGTIRAYSTDGKNIAVINAADNAFVRNNILIIVTVADDYYTLYDTKGEQAINIVISETEEDYYEVPEIGDLKLIDLMGTGSIIIQSPLQ
jgi:phosphoheptose isomerase